MGVDDEAREYHEKYVRVLGRVGVTDLLVERVAEGSVVDASVLDGIDGLFVGGGPMPEYHASLAPAYPRIRELVRARAPLCRFLGRRGHRGDHGHRRRLADRRGAGLPRGEQRGARAR